MLVIAASIAGCASARPQLKGPSEGERAQIDQALAPLVAASSICQGETRCPIGVGVLQLRRIDMAVGPHPPNKFGLTITHRVIRVKTFIALRHHDRDIREWPHGYTS